MRSRVSSLTSLFVVIALALCVGTRALSQSNASQTAGNGTYIAIDPLAKVRYDNRFDASVTMAYDRMKAGPSLLHAASLGGIDLSASYWVSKHWALEGSGRVYMGTSDTQPNVVVPKGAFVMQSLFLAGPEWLGPHNKHGAIILHALGGGALGNFESELKGITPATADFYNDQIAPVAVVGGHIDLNRSEHWVIRITPDAVFNFYSTNYGNNTTQKDVQFAISVGVQYKFSKKR